MKEEFLISKNGLKFKAERDGGVHYWFSDQKEQFHSYDEVMEEFRDVAKNNIIYPQTKYIPHTKPRITDVHVSDTKIKGKREMFVLEAYFSYSYVNETHILENKETNN